MQRTLQVELLRKSCYTQTFLFAHPSFFDGSDITGADFTDALLDGAQIIKLCKQPTGVNSKTGVATRGSLEC